MQTMQTIAERNWHPGAMSRAITWDRDLYEALRAHGWLGEALLFIAAALGPLLYLGGGLALGGWAWLYLLPVLPVATNRLEPMPAGGQAERWGEWPALVRWYLWHVRNPWEDLRKFYLGFGYARRVTEQRLTAHLRIWWWGWLPFPYYKRRAGPVQFMLGWKSRGIISLTVRG
jgi:hypothetical protein